MKKAISSILCLICLLSFMTAGLAESQETKETEMGTRINLTIGDLVIPATLQDNAASRDLLSRLPYTVSLYRGSVDFCGSIEPLETREEDMQHGWEYGDVIWQPNGDWFVIFTDGIETYGNEDCIILAKMDEGWEAIKELTGAVEIEITLGEETTQTKEENQMTKVTLTIGNTVIPATLNDTAAAQNFIKKLPFTVKASRGEYDYCGMGGNLDYDKNETQAGWENGDIGYARGWFALFHDGEDESSSYTSEMIIGHIDDAYLETVRSLPGSVTITVALAE